MCDHQFFVVLSCLVIGDIASSSALPFNASPSFRLCLSAAVDLKRKKKEYSVKKLEIQIPRSAVHVWMGYRTRGDSTRPRQIRCLALQGNSPLVTTHHVAGNGEEADQSARKWKRMKGSNAETQCEVYEQHTSTEEREQI